MTEQLALTLDPRIQIDERHAIFPVGLPFECWFEAMRFFRKSRKCADFWEADGLRFGKSEYGMERTAEAIGQLDFDLGEIKRVEALNQLVERSFGLNKEHHFVLAKAHLDDTAQGMWMELAEKKNLSPRELQESIRMGEVTRIKIDPDKDRGVGFASFESWYLQWKLLRKQIEDVWRDWTPEQAAEALTFLDPVVDFALQVKLIISKDARREVRHQPDNS
jgi:hypothetical protein